MEETKNRLALPTTSGYMIDDLVIDLQRMRVSRDGTEIPLAPLSLDLLVVLAREAPAVVTFDALIDKVWPGTVVSPETVTQRVKLLREALGDDPHAPRYVAAVRGRGYRIVAAATPLNAIAASAVDSQVPFRASIVTRAVRPWWLRWALMSALAIAVAGIAFSVYVPDRVDATLPQTSPRAVAPASSPLAIAVLPFLDLSANRDQEYFADGISEELLNVLSGLQGVRVTGRTSSFRYKGKNEDLRVIGEQLGVHYVLEGSLRKEGTRLRITARLVDTGTGYEMWGESFDRQVADVLDMQDEIAQAVVKTLASKLPAQAGGTQVSFVEARLTNNAEAYTHYLRGRHLLRPRTRVEMKQALVEFQRATSLDPRFFEAYAQQITTLTLLVNYQLLDEAEVLPLAQAAFERLKSLKGSPGKLELAEIHLLDLRNQLIPAALMQRAIDLAPDDREILKFHADFSQTRGYLREELATRDRLLAVDPLEPLQLRQQAWARFRAGRDDLALEAIALLETLEPRGVNHLVARGMLAKSAGRIDDHIRWNARVLSVDPQRTRSHYNLVGSYLDLGSRAGAERHLLSIREQNQDDSSFVALLSRYRLLSGDERGACSLGTRGPKENQDAFDLRTSRAICHAWQGDFAGALTLFTRAKPADPDSEPVVSAWSGVHTTLAIAPDVAFVTRKLGFMTRALAWEKALLAYADRWQSSAKVCEHLTWVARMSAAMGRRAELLAAMRKIDAHGSVLPEWVGREPLFQAFRGDAEIETLLGRFEVRRAQWRADLAAEKL